MLTACIILNADAKAECPSRWMMPPFWPFKRREAGEDEVPKTVDYDREEDTAETMADRSHVEDKGYQSAMDLLINPHLGAPDQGEAVAQTIVEPDEHTKAESATEQDSARYTQSGDGYWYFQNEDGSYAPEAHVKNDDGTFTAYSG